MTTHTITDAGRLVVISPGSEVTLWNGIADGVSARVTAVLIEGDGNSQTIKYRVEYWAGQTLTETFVPEWDGRGEQGERGEGRLQG